MADQLLTAYQNAFQAKEELAETEEALYQLTNNKIQPLAEDTDGQAPVGDTLYDEYNTRLERYSTYLDNFQTAIENYNSVINQHGWVTDSDKEEAQQLGQTFKQMSEKLEALYNVYDSLITTETDTPQTTTQFATQSAEIDTLRDQVWDYATQANQYQNEDFTASLQVEDKIDSGKLSFALWFLKLTFSAPIQEYRNGNASLKQLLLSVVQFIIFLIAIVELVSLNFSTFGGWLVIYIIVHLFARFYVE